MARSKKARAVRIVYAFFITRFVCRDAKWSELPTARPSRTGGILMIMIGFSRPTMAGYDPRMIVASASGVLSMG